VCIELAHRTDSPYLGINLDVMNFLATPRITLRRKSKQRSITRSTPTSERLRRWRSCSSQPRMAAFRTRELQGVYVCGI
jgi:hypothetical protein